MDAPGFVRTYKEEIMYAQRNRSQWAAALAIGLLASISNLAVAEAENQKYTLASLCGDYGAVVTPWGQHCGGLRA